MKWKRYLQYKASGVEWLGEIPAQWKVARAKYCSRLNMGQSPDSDACNEAGNGLPFLQGCAEFGPENPAARQYCETPRKVARKGELLISVRAPVGSLNVADQDYGVGRGLCAVSPLPEILNSRFTWHLLHKVREQLSVLATGSTYDAVAVEDVAGVTFCLPTLSEQCAIAAFLDRETARIDALIEKRQRQIELLQERRAAFISHVATKGLNPNAPMKDSGAVWLGTVPRHWEVRRAKTIFREVNERSTSGDEELLTVSHITGVSRRSEKNVTMFMAESLEDYKKCAQNDLVINTMWAWMGAMGIAPQAGIVSPSYNVYRFRRADCEPRYFDLLFRTRQFISDVICQSKGVWTSRLRLYPEEFFEIRLPVPPLGEQCDIVAAIDKETGRYGGLQARIEESIFALREYRMALISAAVTGKIDVREEVPA